MGEALERLLALAGTVRVSGYERTSTLGNRVRVSAYTRSPAKLGNSDILSELKSLAGSTTTQRRARRVALEREVAARKRRGTWSAKSYPPLRRSEFSNPETPRTRAVSQGEFDTLAAQGEVKVNGYKQRASDTTGLDRNWDSIKKQAWKNTRVDWGGGTVDAHTGEHLEPTGKDQFAITVKEPGVETVAVPLDASQEVLEEAMDTAKARFAEILRRQDHYLGYFRDADTGYIEFDPVLVVSTMDEVEQIGSYTHAVGGAFNFADGLGWWPPYVEDS